MGNSLFFSKLPFCVYYIYIYLYPAGVLSDVLHEEKLLYMTKKILFILLCLQAFFFIFLSFLIQSHSDMMHNLNAELHASKQLCKDLEGESDSAFCCFFIFYFVSIILNDSALSICLLLRRKLESELHKVLQGRGFIILTC